MTNLRPSRVCILIAGGLLTFFSVTPAMARFDPICTSLDCLLYDNTIVIEATLHVGEDKTVTPTVDKLLAGAPQDASGALQAGKETGSLGKLDRSYYPAETGQKVILFLTAAQSLAPGKPAPSHPQAWDVGGMMLIDDAHHVREYEMGGSEGPLVAQGYQFYNGKDDISEEDRLKLPTLSQTEAEIGKQFPVLQTLHTNVLNAQRTGNADALLNLLKQTRQHSKWSPADEQIADALGPIGNIRASLEANVILGFHGVDVLPPFDSKITSHDLETLSDIVASTENPAILRLQAANVLKGWEHPFVTRSAKSNAAGIQPESMADAEIPKIEAVARTVFIDETAPVLLRVACLQLMNPTAATVQDDMKRVYASPGITDELRYAIEAAFLSTDPEQYRQLNPPGGPFTSIVLDRCLGCFEQRSPPATEPLYIDGLYMPHDALDKTTVQLVLTNATSHIAKIMPVQKDSNLFDDPKYLNDYWINKVPVRVPIPNASGDYTVALQFLEDGKVISTGYPLAFSVRQGATGYERVFDSR